MKWRKCCGNCLLVELYEAQEEGQKCVHCGYHQLSASHEFEEESAAHQRNQTRLRYAKDLVAHLEFEIQKFEEGWEKTWNTDDGQLNFQMPEEHDDLDHTITFL